MRTRKRRNTAVLAVLAAVAVMVSGVVIADASRVARTIDEVGSISREVSDYADTGRSIYNSGGNDMNSMQGDTLELFELNGEVSRLCEKISSVNSGTLLPWSRRDIDKARRDGLDRCLAASNMLQGMAGARQFQSAGNAGEARTHQDTAIRMSAEIDKASVNGNTDSSAAGRRHGEQIAGKVPRYVFIILVDALRADHTGAYGYKNNTSPFIDGLAADGLLFENAVSQCSVTDTSVASLLTALYPLSHKMLGRSDWLWELSLVEEFREEGWLTAGFSANSLISAAHHYDHGFGHFECLPFNRAGIIVNQALRWIETNRPDGDRMFVYLHLIDPHGMYLAPPAYQDRFDPGYPRLLKVWALSNMIEKEISCDFNPYTEKWEDRPALIRCINETSGRPEISMRDIANMVARYDAEILYSDSQIERFFAYLKAAGMIEESLVVLLSDHGESFLGHNRIKHGRSLYDSEILVPLIFWRGRDNFGGVRVKEQVEVIDVLPTIFSMVGMKPPAGIHGRDLLDGKKSGHSRQAYSATWMGFDIPSGETFPVFSVREASFKYILNRHGPEGGPGLREEFYNLEEDPGELRDARELSPAEFRHMKYDMSRWLETTDRKPNRPVKDCFDDSKIQDLKDLGYVR